MGEKRGVEGAALGLSKESQHSNYQGSPKISFICVLNIIETFYADIYNPMIVEEVLQKIIIAQTT